MSVFAQSWIFASVESSAGLEASGGFRRLQAREKAVPVQGTDQFASLLQAYPGSRPVSGPNRECIAFTATMPTLLMLLMLWIVQLMPLVK